MNWALALACLSMALLTYSAGRARDPETPVSTTALALSMMIAPGLLALALWGAHGRMDQVRAVLDAMTVDSRALSRGGFSFGGAGQDDLQLPNLPGESLAASLGRDKTLKVTALPLSGAFDGHAAVVSVGLKDRQRFVGAQPFAPGDEVCLEDCEPGGHWLALSSDGNRLIDAGRTDGQQLPAFPERKIWQTVAGVAYWKAGQRIYPLRDFGRPQDAASATIDDPCVMRFLCVRNPASGRGSPARSFLYRQGGPAWTGGGQLQIVLLDPGARIKLAGKDGGGVSAVEPILSHRPESPPAEADVSIWEVRYVDSEVNPVDKKAPPSLLVERRALHLTADDDGLSVKLVTPKTLVGNAVDGQVQGVYRLGGRSKGEARPPEDVRDLSFDVLGGATADATTGEVRIDPRRAPSIETASEGGRSSLSFGQKFALGPQPGAPDGSRQAWFHVDRLQVSWLMPAAALAWGVALMAVMRRSWASQRVAWLLMANLQLLLAIRWLTGWEGVFLDPSLDWRQTMTSAGLAYVVLPAIFALTHLRRGQARLDAIMLAFMVACTTGAFALALGPPSRFDVALIVAFLVGCGLILVGDGDGAGGRLKSWVGAAWGAPARLARSVPRSDIIGRFAGRIPAWGWVLGLGVLARLAVGVGGVKERFTFPETLAVSAIYLPCVLVGFALLFESAGKSADGPRFWPHGVMFSVALLLAMVVAPWVMSDTGFAILALPISIWGLGLGAAAAAGERPQPWPPSRWPWRRWAVASPWIAPGALLCLLLVAALLLAPFASPVLSQHDLDKAQSGDKPAIDLIERVAKTDQIALRIFTIVNPSVLENAGTTEAEQLRVWSAYLNDYTAPLWGRGYLRPSRLGPLADVHLSDNVGAVHVMSPFGRVGAASFLLALAALALSCQRLVPSAAPGRRDWRTTAGLLALWTLFGDAAYMVLANLQLVPFTGRNIYLLAAHSNSDLVEGASLFLMAMVWLWKREARS